MNCTVCNSIIKDTALIDIYYTFTTHTRNRLVNNIKKILNCDFNHSKYICKECYNIFEELDLTEFTYTRIKKQIFERWAVTDCQSLTKDASCQTELFEDDNELSDVLIKKESDFDNDLEEKSSRSETRDKENKLYDCAVCNRRFASKSGMNLHIQRQHPNEQPSDETNLPDSNLEAEISDDNSNNSTKSTNVVKKRVKKEFAIKPLKYSCPQCPKMWRTMGELRNHISSHSNLRPYICEVCGQAYKHKSALDIHVGMHNGINPFSCNYCHKAFTQKGALQRHLPIHTGEAPYQCDLCGKRFVHHTSFNMHTLAHTGQKSYKCTVCGLALLSGSHLKRHMRVHTGERPYACSQCGKRFAERYNLVAHQRLHEAGPSELSKRLYRCQVCGLGFDRRPKLEEHLSNNHNKIAESDPSRKWVGHILNV